MSALEIMDPKMDSGIVSTYYSVDEAIENGAAPVPFDRTMDIQGLIDIMDHLLSCEATWHKGGSLAQTVFSRLYLLRPERTSSHALLHSFCRVIRATCNAVVSAVSDARTNERNYRSSLFQQSTSFHSFVCNIFIANWQTLAMDNCFKDAHKIAKELQANFAGDPESGRASPVTAGGRT